LGKNQSYEGKRRSRSSSAGVANRVKNSPARRKSQKGEIVIGNARKASPRRKEEKERWKRSTALDLWWKNSSSWVVWRGRRGGRKSDKTMPRRSIDKRIGSGFEQRAPH